MNCEYCTGGIPENMVSCPHCGAPCRSVTEKKTSTVQPSEGHRRMSPEGRKVYEWEIAKPRKERSVFLILAFFLGVLGIHNFYAGYISRGLAQLFLTIFLGWLFVPIIAVWIWVIVEMFTTTKSADGQQFIL